MESFFFIDDTYIEQPDTPAPVFAARAFKRAIFGTPAPPAKEAAPAKKEAKTNIAKAETETLTSKKPTSTLDRSSFESPSKPQGILLTPGTGTTRRKRVSFGRDVKSNQSIVVETNAGNRTTRPKTKLQEALENSRKKREDRRSETDESRKLDFDPDAADWEEVDELDREPDITVDLNEPQSQSGQYWKNVFQKYHDEARVEMEKLVRYKQLAKSYAMIKDAEALDLNERLREEQEKVGEMEQKVNELASQLAGQHGLDGGLQDDRKLMKDLARQTALAMEYRRKVNELEALLKDSGYEATDGTRRRPLSTSQTAREQTKELAGLRRELQSVKSELIVLVERETRLEAEKRDLERKLARKDKQYDNLKTDYDALREKNKILRDEISSLRMGAKVSSSGAADLLLDDQIRLFSTEDSAPSPHAKRLEDAQSKLQEQEAARRRDMEEASVNFKRLRQDFKAAAGPLERKTPSQRRLTRLSSDETIDLLQPRRTASARLGHSTPTAARSVSRVSKRSLSGPAIMTKQFAVTERRTPAKSSVDLVRMGRRSRLGLASERAAAADSQSDSDAAEPKLTRGSSRGFVSKSRLPAERQAAAIARLDQKRAERRRARESSNALPGKENLRP